MTETGLYRVDVWVDFDTVDTTGHLLANPIDFHDESLLAPGKVVAAFDDDHVAPAAVAGRVRQGNETRVHPALAPGDVDHVVSIARAVSDSCDEWSLGRQG